MFWITTESGAFGLLSGTDTIVSEDVVPSASVMVCAATGAHISKTEDSSGRIMAFGMIAAVAGRGGAWRGCGGRRDQFSTVLLSTLLNSQMFWEPTRAWLVTSSPRKIGLFGVV